VPGRLRQSHRLDVLLAALVLFAAIFSARFVDATIASGVTILYVLPVVLLAVEFGFGAGLAAGAVAFALFAAWAPFAPVPVPAISYVSRAVAFLVVGAVAGRLADRVRAQSDQVRGNARHFELARDLLCTASFDGYLLQLNGAWEQCLGWAPEELRAHPFLTFVHPDDRASTIEQTTRLLHGELTESFTNRYRTKEGGWRWIEWSSQADLERRLIYAAARDVTERHEAEERLRHLADHDSLSGVFNRRRFEQELARELEHGVRRGSRGAVLLLDVDDFKAINDTRGHAVGDAVIARVGGALRDRLRSSDVVARLGGDEFAVLLRRVDAPTALELARALQVTASEQAAAAAGKPVTLSVGLAPVGAGYALDVDAALSRADHAMYAAKRRGGDAVAVAGSAADASLAAPGR
jgi:diguanylate cyclase (GGDEF)-like protein/PAS domain S-box-containing protein